MPAETSSTRSETDIPPEQWETWGSKAAGVSIIFVPAAVVALFCGYKLTAYNERAGYGIIKEALVYASVWAILLAVLLLL